VAPRPDETDPGRPVGVDEPGRLPQRGDRRPVREVVVRRRRGPGRRTRGPLLHRRRAPPGRGGDRAREAPHPCPRDAGFAVSRVVAALPGALAVGAVVDVARYAREQTAVANRWRNDYFDL